MPLDNKYCLHIISFYIIIWVIDVIGPMTLKKYVAGE